MERFKKSGIVLFAILLVYFCFDLHAEHLPYRKELNSDIKFWKKVFTEISSNQYIIHDSQYLSIIYTVVTFPPSTNERERQRSLRTQLRKSMNACLCNSIIIQRILLIYRYGSDVFTIDSDQSLKGISLKDLRGELELSRESGKNLLAGCRTHSHTSR